MDDADWDQDHDEAAGHRARPAVVAFEFRPAPARRRQSEDCADRLARERGSSGWQSSSPSWRSCSRDALAGCGGDWGQADQSRDGDPWLAAAIEENIGHGNTVEVGGTQIERAGRIRIAVRIRDIVVRDRDDVVVATRAEGRG